MIVTATDPVYYVTFAGAGYVRFFADAWMRFYRESLETVYDCESLEAEFQKITGGQS